MGTTAFNPYTSGSVNIKMLYENQSDDITTLCGNKTGKVKIQSKHFHRALIV